MIKNIILDIGNVLGAFCWEQYLKGFGFSDEVYEKVARATFLGKYWKEVDRGVFTEEELLESFFSLGEDCKEEIKKVFDQMEKSVVEYDYAAEWIQEFQRNGYKVYILSNYGERNFKYARETMKFLKYPDGKVISYQEKKIKPDKEIYRILLNRYHLIPEECVFLDDTKINIEAAKECGMYGIWFHDREQAEAELRELNVNI
jgi:putative hydrolase of the HAD superfamily